MKHFSYFQHDSNARNDDKVIALRMKHGAEGYGIYFMIIERLRESTDYMSVKDYNIIAFDLRVSAEKIKSVVEDFGLFVFAESGKHFYSESLNKRMEIKDDRSVTAKKAAEIRWKKEKSKQSENQSVNANAMQTHSERNAKAMPIKKESKESKERIVEGDNASARDVDESSFDDQTDRKPWQGFTMEELETELTSAKIWQGDLGKSVGITDPGDIPKWIVKFFVFLRGQGKVHTTIREAKSHCQSWIRRQLELGKSLDSGPTDKPTDLENPNRPPDNSGKWLFLNGKWRDTTTFTNAQKRKFGLIPEATV